MTRRSDDIPPANYWVDIIFLACVPLTFAGVSGLTLLLGGTP